MKTLFAADLFAGAGGTSTGLARACKARGQKVDLLAVNHWDLAIQTHKKNHPWARHLCQSLDAVDPRVEIPGQRLDLMVASPECVGHSKARGGRPIHDQRRASAWNVLRWAELIKINAILIENVVEFEDWGPLDSENKKIKARAGETFRAFMTALTSLGYNVDYRHLVAADYGDATTRERLFIMARRRGKIVWPTPSHSSEEGDLFPAANRWKIAEEIIDWKIRGVSIYNRARPLVNNTLAKIKMGMLRYNGEAFIIPFFGKRKKQAPRTHSIHEPLPTVTSHGAGALVQPVGLARKSAKPFVIKYFGTGIAKPVTVPLDTITTKDRFALVEPKKGGDILLRMFTPRELGRAMGFGDDYEFMGNRTDQIKQVGNAVACGTAQALCGALLEN